MAHRSTRLRNVNRVALALTYLCTCVLWAQPLATEYQVKAAYLLNFGKFVKFPQPISSGTDSFVVCVLGDDPFGPILDATVRDERIDGKTVVARRISRAVDAAGCRILFVSRSEGNRVLKSLPSLNKAGILTVSDMPAFLDHEGMIQFTIVGSRIRFEVNLDPIQEAGLTLSSELLKVAGAVRGKGLGGSQ